jgi:aspartyl-tRNA(Asn)/glutamyl-tRNA(Gln) amidotransferase subunit C
MAHDIDIKNLAALARIDIDSSEAENLEKDVASILGYVEQVQTVQVTAVESSVGEVYNILREDGEPHQSGMYTETLLREVPERQGDYVKVKKIL